LFTTGEEPEVGGQESGEISTSSWEKVDVDMKDE
jgi:hypothetical protein